MMDDDEFFTGLCVAIAIVSVLFVVVLTVLVVLT